jgi:hypothetical protein
MGREHCGSVKDWQVDVLFKGVGVVRPCVRSFEKWAAQHAQISPRALRGVMRDNGLAFAELQSGGVTIRETTPGN